MNTNKNKESCVKDKIIGKPNIILHIPVVFDSGSLGYGIRYAKLAAHKIPKTPLIELKTPIVPEIETGVISDTNDGDTAE